MIEDSVPNDDGLLTDFLPEFQALIEADFVNELTRVKNMMEFVDKYDAIFMELNAGKEKTYPPPKRRPPPF
jgi:hypothetical protein